MLKAARLGERYSDRTLNPGDGMACARRLDRAVDRQSLSDSSPRETAMLRSIVAKQSELSGNANKKQETR